MNTLTEAATQMKSSTEKAGDKPKAPFDMRKVRAHFILRGTTLRQWTIGKGFTQQLGSYAVYGQRTGPSARKFLRKLKKELAT